MTDPIFSHLFDKQRQPCTLSLFGSLVSASPECSPSENPRDSSHVDSCPYRAKFTHKATIAQLFEWFDLVLGFPTRSYVVIRCRSGPDFNFDNPGCLLLYTLRSCLVSTYLYIPCCILSFDGRSPSRRSIRRSLWPYSPRLESPLHLGPSTLSHGRLFGPSARCYEGLLFYFCLFLFIFRIKVTISRSVFSSRLLSSSLLSTCASSLLNNNNNSIQTSSQSFRWYFLDRFQPLLASSPIQFTKNKKRNQPSYRWTYNSHYHFFYSAYLHPSPIRVSSNLSLQTPFVRFFCLTTFRYLYQPLFERSGVRCYPLFSTWYHYSSLLLVFSVFFYQGLWEL